MSNRGGSKNKEYLFSLYKTENYTDKPPAKTIRKYKRRERQKGKKIIKKELKEQ